MRVAQGRATSKPSLPKRTQVQKQTETKKPTIQTVEKTREEVIDEKSKQFLRPVNCPLEVIEAFRQVSDENTNELIETCGILAGYQDCDNNLVITTLIIPSQEGDEETCCMVDEMELFKI